MDIFILEDGCSYEKDVEGQPATEWGRGSEPPAGLAGMGRSKKKPTMISSACVS